MDSLVTIGKIVKPQGIKGELRIEFYAEDLSLLEKPLLIRAGKLSPRPIKVRNFHITAGVIVLSIEGCNDRSAAESLRGNEIVVEKQYVPEEPDGENESEEIIGYGVFSSDNKKIGIVQDVQFPAGNEVWSILSDDGHEILFPAVPQFILEQDEHTKKIIVNPPAGLLEIYSSEKTC